MQSQQIKLRALEPTDIDLLYEWENDQGVWQLSNTVAPFSRFVLEQYLLNAQQDIFAARQLRLMIDEETDEGFRTVGAIDLFDFDPVNLRAGVGILIANKYRRRGCASEALKLLIDYAFKTLHLHQLYCHIQTKNEGSLILFQKHGFIEAGYVKHWLRTNNDWEDAMFLQLINPFHPIQ